MTSKVEVFAIIFYGFQLLTAVTKSSIVDAAVLIVFQQGSGLFLSFYPITVICVISD